MSIFCEEPTAETDFQPYFCGFRMLSLNEAVQKKLLASAKLWN